MPEVTKQQAKRSKRIVLTTAVLTILVPYTISLFVPGISPYTRYPLYVVKCAGRPVIASDFAGHETYITPGSRFYGINPFTTAAYFCSEEAARAHGYYKDD